MVSPGAQEFGRYYLVQRIAAGGMAEVFKARYAVGHDIEKTCVIKRILPHLAMNKSFVSMFEDEARICVSLNHNNIVKVFDYGRVGDDHFLAMEYVKGQNLQRIINRLNDRNERLPLPIVIHIVSEVAKGLHYAHTRKDDSGDNLEIIHRDVSPANILVSYEGEVKLVDFGIAKAASQSEQTQAGTIKGKASYMAPEYLLGARDLDGRVDVFALGAVMWEMLAGHKLFHGESEMEIIGMVSQAEIPLPSTEHQAISPAVDSVVMGALSRDREQRYSTANDFYRALIHLSRKLGAIVTEPDVGEYLQALFEQEMEDENAADREISKTLAGLTSPSNDELSAPTGQPIWNPVPENTDPAIRLETTGQGVLSVDERMQEHTDPGGPAFEPSLEDVPEEPTNPHGSFDPAETTNENRTVDVGDETGQTAAANSTVFEDQTGTANALDPGDATANLDAGDATADRNPWGDGGDATTQTPRPQSFGQVTRDSRMDTRQLLDELDATDENPLPPGPVPEPAGDMPTLHPPPQSLDGLEPPQVLDENSLTDDGDFLGPPTSVPPDVLRDKAKKLAAKAIKKGVLKPKKVRRTNWLKGILIFVLLVSVAALGYVVVATSLGYHVPFVSDYIVDVTPIPSATATAPPATAAPSPTPAATTSAKPSKTPRKTPKPTTKSTARATPAATAKASATPKTPAATANAETTPEATATQMLPAPTVTPEAYEDLLDQRRREQGGG